MTPALVLDNLAAYCFQVAVLSAAAAALMAAARLRTPKAALAYWQIVLAAALLLPIVQPWKQAVIPAAAPAVFDWAPEIPASLAPPVPPAEQPFRWPIREAVGFILVAGTAARLLWLATGSIRLHLLRRRAAPLEPEPDEFRELRFWMEAEAGILLSREVDSPVTFGLLRPVILLPARFTGLDAAFQRAVICHELLHVRRRDWTITLAEEIVRAVLWFHPAIWFILSRIHLAREQAVDREAVEWSGDRSAYLGALLESANVRGRLTLAPAPLFLRKRHFTKRVALIVKEASMSPLRVAFTLIAILFLLAPAATLAVRVFPLEGSPVLLQAAQQTPDAPSRIKVGGAVQYHNLIHRVDPVYPPLARQARIQGTVRFEATIDAEGGVKNLMLMTGHPLLVPAAQDAVREWRYRPTLLNGKPVEVITQIDVNFVLDGEPASAANVIPARRYPLSFHKPPFADVPPAAGVKRIQVAEDHARQKLVYSTPAQAPPEIKGVVRVFALIGLDGAVKDVLIVGGHPLLQTPVLEAVRQYRFEPTLVDGQAAEVVAELAVPVPADFKPDAHAVEVRGVALGGVPGGVAGGVPGGVHGGPYRVDPANGVSTPLLIRRVEPGYTEEARNQRVEGMVMLRAVVRTNGRADQITVVNGLTHGLNEKAIEAVKQWEFQPGMKDGKPADVFATIEINFRLR